ncbi:MAG: aminopeptidase N [Deltaproteobacteria bacterium]|nr:aminopeptidase N [Deltaproteobacteria bacterium]
MSNVRYQLSFDLDGHAKTYDGVATIDFDLKELDGDLTLDFDGGKVLALSIGGKQVPPSHRGAIITLPQQRLTPGPNQVRVTFRHPYSDNGEELSRYVDPEDGLVYLFTDLEPFYANRVFPCFDQPDLKATFELTVDAPESWVVISSVKETSVSALPKRRARHVFPASPRFSTYLFSLHAGDYVSWSDESHRVPLRLFARRALAQHLRAEEFFEVTRRGLDYFERYFGIPYPFPKYDQIVAPAMNYEAMENVGAVTIQEAFVYRGAPTRQELEGRARLILHEMAHMWFGNLVTMVWWDDLWLNEAFASYMSSLAVQAVVEGHRTWISFNSSMKQSAYLEDQLPTTHPVAGRIQSTEEAFSSFDGITYGKGASVLRQLGFALGSEVFRLGVSDFLKRHAFGSAARASFVESLSRAAPDKSKMDLRVWSESWLESAGLDSVRVDVECKGGKIDGLYLESDSRARRHVTRVGLYSCRGECSVGAGFVLTSSRTVSYAGPRTRLEAFAGDACPDFVWPNLGDEDYVKVALAPEARERAQLALPKIDDPLLRLMLWQSLWESVRSAELSAPRYSEIVTERLGSQELPEIAAFVISTLGRGGLEGSVRRYVPSKIEDRLERFLGERLSSDRVGSDTWKASYDGLTAIARSPETQQLLLQVFGSGTLDPERRWSTLEVLSSLDHPEVAKLLAAERQSDRSAPGRIGALRVEAARPSLDSKRKLLKRLRGPTLSLEEKIAVMSSILPARQEDLRELLSAELLALLRSASKDDELESRMASMLVPATCSLESVRRLEPLISSLPAASASVRRELTIALDEDKRCARVREVALKSVRTP